MKKTLKIKKIALEVIPAYSWWYWIGVPLCLLVSTLCFYYSSLEYQFQFDDVANITKHFQLRHYTWWDLFFSGPRWISYWLNTIQYSIGRFDPYFYRLFNVCLHTSNGLLLFFILMTGLSRRKRDDFFKQNTCLIASVTALLFLLHPVQTQTVSYVIQGQLEGLAAFFVLSMILVFMQSIYIQRFFLKGTAFALLMTLTIFSCCTKEIAIVSPALLLLVDWFFIAQGSWQELKKRIWIHGLVALCVVSIFAYFFRASFFIDIFALKRIAHNNIGNVITPNGAALITPGHFFISQFKVLLHYFWIFVWPFSISVEYDWKLSDSFFSLDSCLPCVMLCALVFFIGRSVKRESSNMIAYGLIWFLICMAPRATIIPSPELLADYKTYLASAGWLLLIAALLVYLYKQAIECIVKRGFTVRQTKYAGCSAAFSLLLLLGFSTTKRNRVWRSGLDFWGNIIENAPGKARAYNNYGVELLQQCKQYKESIPYFTKAIAMDAQYYDPYHNVAVAYIHTNQPALAMEALAAGLKINPSYPEGYNNLASFLLQQGEYEKAESALHTALQLRTHYGKAHYNLGRLYFETGKYELAWNHFRDACMNGDLDDTMGFAAFAKVSLLLKKYDDAIIGYTKMLELVPNDHDSLFNLGNAYLLAERPDQALSVYEHLVALYPHDFRGWYNLGETYCLKQQPAEAIACFKKIAAVSQNFPSYHMRLAQCYGMVGNFDAAYHALDHATAAEVSAEVVAQARNLRTELQKKERQG